MSTYEDAIEIAAPADRTFELVSDPRLLSRIDPNASVRLLSGDWTSVGSRHHVTTKVGGRVIDAVHEITRFEPPRLIEERITSVDTVMVGTDEVRPLGDDRCVLTVRLEIDWGGGLMELVSRLVFPLRERSRRRVLERIRELAESTLPR